MSSSFKGKNLQSLTNSRNPPKFLSHKKKPKVGQNQLIIPTESGLLGLTSNTGKRQLASLSSYDQSTPQKKKSKTNIHIAKVSSNRNSTPPAFESKSTRNNPALKEFDISAIKESTNKLLNQIKDHNTKAKSTAEVESGNSKYLDKLLAEANKNKFDDDYIPEIDSGINLSRDIYDDSAKIKEVQLKYTKEKFSPLPINKDDLLRRVSSKLGIAEKILNGKIGSYFYELARDFSESSHRLSITDMEIINLPKDKYHGYMGTLRAHLISRHIIEVLGSLLTEKNKFNKVVQFWGINYFTRYVLTSEIIARLVAEDYNYGEDLDKSYDMMENTNDYGLYIMDKIDPEPPIRIETLESDESSLLVYEGLPESTPKVIGKQSVSGNSAKIEGTSVSSHGDTVLSKRSRFQDDSLSSSSSDDDDDDEPLDKLFD